ncbi:TauD/TfdA dioxygenase family protein [Mycobacterium talmoniae]|uniref:Alpha-ketoglutarate-dependent sulfate ester dioxygenase n=1 Tax=Mycobacterium talmoniae TaxID=1858794 RepID=A0A1S1NIZ4_9MYCO|nr:MULTISPECIES: TauD/TfdA family dioxygenase [Mycobacterium]OHV04039.1 taurine catabolism dioxygenase [Mycobacterium talmoniae]PQM44710.1 Alpha-ketoglutarate-dependent sulfate ester dioxygenase [Mycobacterium talmoniae]TDH49240.1 TauD/TfdA family dioxygenase [Mycobacterium eburneum]
MPTTLSTRSEAPTLPAGATLYKLTADIGAAVTGLRLGGDLDAATVRAIRRAVLDHKVVIFRGQQHLDDDTQRAFAGLLGPLTLGHPTLASRTAGAVLEIDSEHGRTDSWHTDVTFVDRPPAFSVLRPIVLPDYGGTTAWANTAAAYQGLPGQLRLLADSLRAVHTNRYDYVRTHQREPDKGQTGRERHDARAHYEEFRSTTYETEHPVVRVHPETGERALLLGQFVSRIEDLKPSESDALYRIFQDRITKLENTVRWHWELGDVAIWDNRATQHYGVSDYDDLHRRLHRVTVAGDVPVGVDGRPSRSLVGESTAYLSFAG